MGDGCVHKVACSPGIDGQPDPRVSLVTRKEMEQPGLDLAGTNRGWSAKSPGRVKITNTVPLIWDRMKYWHPSSQAFWVFCTRE